MSDTPSPIPTSEPAKPRLSLTPKVAAAPATAPAPAPATPTPPASHTPPSITQGASDARPPVLTSSGLKPSFKLQGNVHSAADKLTDDKPLIARKPVDDGPSPVLTAISALAAAAAITFAVLLYLKTQ